MKILLVHPDDSVEVGPWATTNWNLVVDLGWSGSAHYAQQTERLGCRVLSIYDVLEHDQHRQQIREILSVGLGLVVDSESVDWWETFCFQPYNQLEQILLLSALAEQVPDHAEVFSTRPHSSVRALSLLLNREIRSYASEPHTGVLVRAGRYLKAGLNLRSSQLIEIAFDKWDTDYRIRRHFSALPRVSSTPAILLPSAYSNVTRAQVAYARMLPHQRFLLVVTRRNGRLPNLPGNVELRWLASYAPGSLPSTERDRARLTAIWQQVQNDLFGKSRILSLAKQLQAFDVFGSFLKAGLGVRDAWREVLAQEHITAVLSADEHNPFTRLPILLARSRKLRTVFCDHGALNMSLAFRRPCSDTYLVRGDMARDYLAEWCGLSANKIIVGSPYAAPRPLPPANPARKDWIVFFSEAYEVSQGRTQAFYKGLLPELCALAQQTNRKVIVKLHPFESRRTRMLLVRKVLSREQRRLIEMREGPMTSDLFERAWFTVTVESSVAVESASYEVPCFLCSWFDASWYEYTKQYAKYSAGYLLDSPKRVREIPQLLERVQITEATRQGLESPISPKRLESVLAGT